MKKHLLSVAILVAAVLVAAVAWGSFLRKDHAPTGAVSAGLNAQPTDFVQVGTLMVDSPAAQQGTIQFAYGEPGAPTTTKRLVLDELSVCATATGALPCVAMSVTFDAPFDGRRAIVEGIEQPDGAVLARKLRRLEEGESGLPPAPGSVFISWPQAVSLIEGCAVEMAVQAHSLSVSLALKDGRRFVAVEPIIDEVFQVTQRAQPSCGDIVIATE